MPEDTLYHRFRSDRSVPLSQANLNEDKHRESLADHFAQRPYKARGPTAYRGAQYVDASFSDLIRLLDDAQNRLRWIETSARNPASPSVLDRPYVRMTRTELAKHRLRALDALTDLRAEIRRRGKV